MQHRWQANVSLLEDPHRRVEGCMVFSVCEMVEMLNELLSCLSHKHFSSTLTGLPSLHRSCKM